MSEISPLREAVPRKQAGQRSYGGVAPQERTAQRRERLIAAGVEVFGTRGFHAATVREICGAARLTERYFYESFRSLAELFAVVYDKLTGELKQATLDALAASEKRPLKLAEAGLRCFMEFIRQDPRRARIVLIDAVSISQDSKAAVDQSSRDYVALMESFLRSLYPHAADLGIDIHLLSVALIGMNIHIATKWARDGFHMPMDEVLATNLLIYQGLDQVISATATSGVQTPSVS